MPGILPPPTPTITAWSAAAAAPSRRRGLAAVAIHAGIWSAAAGSFPSPLAAAQQAAALVIRPLAEKEAAELPPGPLVWRIETFPTLAQERAAAGPTALAAEAGGRAWLFTLGPAGGATPGGTRIAEVGPLPEVLAPRYLLRINDLSGPPGGATPVHTHPGSEAFYVLTGETSQRTPHGVASVAAGRFMVGHGADTVMEVSNSGPTDLHALVMFVVDATRPFMSPAAFR
jgi:quercetin dioxygenase-like cupin family protein